MTRPTPEKSLAALAGELRNLERASRMAGLKASSACSLADDHAAYNDTHSDEMTIHQRSAAAGYRARQEALSSIHSRLVAVADVLSKDDAAWSR